MHSDGAVVHEVRVPSTPCDIAVAPARLPTAISRYRRLSRIGAAALSVKRGRLHWQHLEMRRSAGLLYETANVMLTRYKPALSLKDWAFEIAK